MTGIDGETYRRFEKKRDEVRRKKKRDEVRRKIKKMGDMRRE